MFLQKVISILLIVSLLFPQRKHCFSDDELKGIYNGIQELQYKDSLNIEMQKNLESQIQDYIVSIENDSLIIFKLESQLELKDELIEIITPKWYENKYLWFGYGVATIIIPIWVIGQLK